MPEAGMAPVEAVVTLGRLMARACVLELGGAKDVAGDVSARAAAELRNLSDEGLHVVFAAFLGFFSAFVWTTNSDRAKPYLEMMEQAGGDPAAMRAAVDHILNALVGGDALKEQQC